MISPLLIDFRVAGNIIYETMDKVLIMLLVSFSGSLTVKALDGTLLGRGQITECTIPLHTESLSFIITKSPLNPITLGLP